MTSDKRAMCRLIKFLEVQARTNDAFANDAVKGSKIEKEFRAMAEGNRRAVARLRLESETPKGKTQ